MPLNATALDVGSDAIASAAGWLSLHSAQPDASGSNQTSAARVAAGWVSGNNGVNTATNKSFTGGAASGAVTHVGFWSASTAGTFYGYQAVTGDQSFNAAGQYTLNTVTITLA